MGQALRHPGLEIPKNSLFRSESDIGCQGELATSATSTTPQDADRRDGKLAQPHQIVETGMQPGRARLRRATRILSAGRSQRAIKNPGLSLRKAMTRSRTSSLARSRSSPSWRIVSTSMRLTGPLLSVTRQYAGETVSMEN